MKKVIFAAIAVCGLFCNTWGMDTPVPMESQNVYTEILHDAVQSEVQTLSNKTLSDTFLYILRASSKTLFPENELKIFTDEVRRRLQESLSEGKIPSKILPLVSYLFVTPIYYDSVHVERLQNAICGEELETWKSQFKSLIEDLKKEWTDVEHNIELLSEDALLAFRGLECNIDIVQMGLKPTSAQIHEELMRRNVAEMSSLSQPIIRPEAEDFCYALKLPKDTKIFIMNAESYISGAGLSEEDKKFYNELRFNPKALLKEFSSKVSFETLELKEKIITNITPYIYKNQLYRDAITCYLARTRVTPFFRDRCGWNLGECIKAIPAFISDYESRYYPRSGEISLSFVPLFRHTFGNSLYQLLELPTGVTISLQNSGAMVYHEIGHHRYPIGIETLFSDFTWQNLQRENIRKLCGAFTRISTNEEIFSEWLDSVYEKGGDCAILSLSALLDGDRESSLLDSVLLSFDYNASEFFQIMGLVTIKNAGQTYLFINDMSDLHLAVQLGLPIVMNHKGDYLHTLMQVVSGNGYSILNPNYRWLKSIFTQSSYINTFNVECFLQMQDNPSRWIVSSDAKTPVKFTPNLNAYGPLLEMFGTSIYEYWSKMMYPYGLLSTLSFEHKLYTVDYRLLGKTIMLPSRLVLRGRNSDELQSSIPSKRKRLIEKK